jgi:hypothetical protein
MTFPRALLLFALLFSLGWSGNVLAASKTSSSIAGTWHGAHGKSITFKKNGTINYHGKRYYYAVSSGGFIQLKGKHGDLTIPFGLAGGKLTLTENGETTVYRRRR